jgi:hypothetical protein
MLLLVLAMQQANAGDTIRAALTSLCDPAKIATLESERGANPRIRKIAYWLEIGRREGRTPKTRWRQPWTRSAGAAHSRDNSRPSP